MSPCYHPGSGAKPGNLNALNHGRASKRALRLLRLYLAHPNRRAIIRHLIIEGVVDPDRPPTEASLQPGTVGFRNLIRALDAIFDRSGRLYDQFNQFDQFSEAGAAPANPNIRMSH